MLLDHQLLLSLVELNTCTVPETSPLPENALEDGYDDVTGAPGPRDASLSGQNEQEIIGILGESDRNKDLWAGEARRAVLFCSCSQLIYTCALLSLHP